MESIQFKFQVKQLRIAQERTILLIYTFFDIAFCGSGSLAILRRRPPDFWTRLADVLLVWWLVEKVNTYQNDHCGAIGDVRFSDYDCLHLQMWCFVCILLFSSLPTTHATCETSCSEPNQGRESSMDLWATIWERRRQVPSCFLQVMWPLAKPWNVIQRLKILAFCQVLKHVKRVIFKLN